jgi:hypothetical protein
MIPAGTGLPHFCAVRGKPCGMGLGGVDPDFIHRFGPGKWEQVG